MISDIIPAVKDFLNVERWEWENNEKISYFPILRKVMVTNVLFMTKDERKWKEKVKGEGNGIGRD